MQDGSEIVIAVAGEVQDSNSLHPAVHTHGSIDPALREHKQLKVYSCSTHDIHWQHWVYMLFVRSSLEWQDTSKGPV